MTSNRWVVLGLLSFARISMGLHLQSLGALAPSLAPELGLDYVEVGLLVGIFMLPGACLALPGGMVSRRIGDKATLLGGLVLLTVGAGLLGASHGMTLAVVARLVSGAGGVLVSMQVVKLVAAWFAGREIATAMGLMLGTFPLGIALALAVMSGLAASVSWRSILLGAAAITALTAVLVAVLYRERPAQVAPAGTGRPPLWSITRPELRLVIVAGVANALLNGTFLVFNSFMPTLLISQGRSEAEAGALTSWAALVSIGSGIVGGYLLDRAGHGSGWIVLAIVASSAAFVGPTLAEPAPVWIMAYGIAFTPAVVGLVTLPGLVLREDSRATGFGVFYTLLYLGFVVHPPIAGFVLDATGDSRAPIWLGGGLLLAAAPIMLVFGWLHRRMPPAAHPGDAEPNANGSPSPA